MIKKLDLNDTEIIKKILDLQIRSYSIEAHIVNFYEIPPLKDNMKILKKCCETFLGYFTDDTLSGILSYKKEGDVIDIYRVATHPDFFRRGIAEKLINYIEENNNDVKKIIVSTGKENNPAVRLYQKAGFKKTMDKEVEEGFYITSFEKIL